MALSVSSGFRAYYGDGNAPIVKATLTLADSTVVELTGADLAMGGISVEGASSPSNTLALGAAIVGSATVTLWNGDMRFDTVDFEGAQIQPYAGAVVDGDVEWALLGTYDVERPDTMGATVPLSCRDRMGRFEVAYSDVTTTYPATLHDIVDDICDHCGVTLSQSVFNNSAYAVASRPTEDVSCIDVIGWVAALAGGWATMTPIGQLAFRSYDLTAYGTEDWLDGGSFAGTAVPYADGDDADGGGFMHGGDEADGGSFTDARPTVCYAIRSLEVGTDDIAITGVRVTAQDEPADEDGEPGAVGETSLHGSEGYVLPIADNPLVAYGQASTVAAMVAPLVVGMVTRTVNASVIGDPSVQAGDPMLIVDRRQRAYRTYLTGVVWRSSGSQDLLCGAQAPSRQASRRRTGLMALALEQMRSAVRAVGTATAAARAIADQASAVAEATNQHFWTDANGVHVTEVEQDDWDDGGSASYHSGPNILINSLGMLLRDGLNNLTSWTGGAIAFYDGLGNAAANVTAYFGRDGSRIGNESSRHIDVDDDSITMFGSYDNDVMTISVSGWEDYRYFPVDGTYPLTITYPRAVDLSYLEWTSFQPYPTSGPVSTWTEPSGRGDVWDFDPETCELTLHRADWEPEYEGDEPSYVFVGFVSMRPNVASGAESESTGGDSAAFGSGVVADGCGQVVVGKWNQSPPIDPLDPTATWPFIVGDGSDGSSRHNAFGVDEHGDTHVYGSLSLDGSTALSAPLPVASGGTGSDGYGELMTDNVTADADAVSVATSTYTSLADLTLTKGTWLLVYNARFESNATGQRYLFAHTSLTSNNSMAIAQRAGGINANAVQGSGRSTFLNACRVVQVTATQQTWHAVVWQNSGSTLAANGFFRAFRLL